MCRNSARCAASAGSTASRHTSGLRCFPGDRTTHPPPTTWSPLRRHPPLRVLSLPLNPRHVNRRICGRASRVHRTRAEPCDHQYVCASPADAVPSPTSTGEHLDHIPPSIRTDVVHIAGHRLRTGTGADGPATATTARRHSSFECRRPSGSVPTAVAGRATPPHSAPARPGSAASSGPGTTTAACGRRLRRRGAAPGAGGRRPTQAHRTIATTRDARADRQRRCVGAIRAHRGRDVAQGAAAAGRRRR